MTRATRAAPCAAPRGAAPSSKIAPGAAASLARHRTAAIQSMPRPLAGRKPLGATVEDVPDPALSSQARNSSMRPPRFAPKRIARTNRPPTRVFTRPGQSLRYPPNATASLPTSSPESPRRSALGCSLYVRSPPGPSSVIGDWWSLPGASGRAGMWCHPPGRSPSSSRT